MKNLDSDGDAPQGGTFRRHPLAWSAALVLVVAGGVGLYAWKQVNETLAPKYTSISYTVPKADKLTARSGETVYRIDPTKSSVGYTIEEKIFGVGANTARGTTNGIAGDIAVNRSTPASTRAGRIVVNVEQLHSDNNLRDARIRKNYLQSHEYPLALLDITKFDGMPASLVDGQTYSVRAESFLTVKQTQAPVTWNLTAKVENGRLSADGTARVKLSAFKVGPISLAGLVSTSDDTTLSLHLTAVDPSKYTVPTEITPPVGAKASGPTPSFKRDIMPILEARCASCHATGQVGAAHWTLMTANDAKQVSDGIGTVVRARFMPPWPASDLGVPLADSKRLSAAQIDTIVRWSQAGGQLDVPGNTAVPATEGQPGPKPRHDIVLTMQQGYAGSMSQTNDYRCFVLDPKFTKPTYVTGYEVTPGVRAEIHHVQVFQIDAVAAADGLARSGQDGKPGWSCGASPSFKSRRRFGRFGQHGPAAPTTTTAPNPQEPHAVDEAAVNGVTYKRRPNFSTQAGLMAGWVPGQDPVVFPLHSGVLFMPGDQVVYQVHYHYDRTPIPDRSTIALQVEVANPSVKPIDIVNPVGPVEIPCDPGATEKLCDRGASVQEAIRQYGPAGGFIEQGLLMLCGKSQEQLAAAYKDGVGKSDCTTTIPETGRLVAVLGHEHTLGKSFRFTLDPGTPNAKVLLDIPTWNFNWQMNYALQTPLHVTAGQQIRMDCSWDRSLDPNRPSKYIIFAEGTEDEMCFGTYAIIPDQY